MTEPVLTEHIEATVDKPKRKDVLRSPDKNLKVSYVIPIKGEVKNGNIFQQIKNLTLQDSPVSDFEAIYVVNNTQEDREAQNDSFKQNQQLLSIFGFIAGETDALPEGLEEWQQGIVIAAKEKGVHISALDLTTEDNDRGSGITRDIDNSRFVGIDTAVNRFADTDKKDDGVIMRMDADTRIDRHVTSQVVDQLVNRPITDVQMLKILYDTIPGEGGRRLYETASEERLINNLHNLRIHLTGGTTWFAAKVGTFDKVRIKKVDMANDIRIYTQDRARSSDIAGAFSHARFKELDQPRKEFKQEIIDQLTYIKQYARLSDEINNKITDAIDSSPDDINEYIDVYRNIVGTIAGPNRIDELRDIVASEERRERIRHDVVSGTVNSVLKRMYDPRKSDKELSEATIHEYLSDSDNPRQQTPKTHFIYQNPWIIDVLNEAKQKATNPEEAKDWLNEKFPELLRPFDETTYTRANATILGLIRFMEQINFGKISIQ